MIGPSLKVRALQAELRRILPELAATLDDAIAELGADVIALIVPVDANASSCEGRWCTREVALELLSRGVSDGSRLRDAVAAMRDPYPLVALGQPGAILVGTLEPRRRTVDAPPNLKEVH